MNISDIGSVLLTLEHGTYPVRGLPVKKEVEINGKKVRAESKMNKGRSGKMFTTLFYVDGVRVARANLSEAIAK